MLRHGGLNTSILAATSILRNGKIVTVDESLPEAQAVAIRGDRIVAVGTNQDMTGPT